MNQQGAIIMHGSGIRTRKMPDRFYKTYEISAPIETHTRRASCLEAECKAYSEGWTYKKADLIAADLYELVTHAGKRFRETSLDESSEVYLVFEPGQPCFQAAHHRVSLERPEFFRAARGAGSLYNPRKAAQFDTAEDWADSFATHQDLINRVVQEGI